VEALGESSLLFRQEHWVASWDRFLCQIWDVHDAGLSPRDVVTFY
jgi:hypothetical protein